MLITQRRAIERRIANNDTSYAQIARELSPLYTSSVRHIATDIGYKKRGIARLQFMVRAQNALLRFKGKVG